MLSGISLLAGHSQDGKKIECLVLIYEMCTFGVEADEMRAVLPLVSANAVVDAEQIGVRAIDAFTQGYADLGHRNVTRLADGIEILALDIMRATLKRCVLKESVDPAAHEDVRTVTLVGLDLLQAFVDPVDAIAAVDHPDYLDSFRCRTHSSLMVCRERAMPKAPGGTSSVMQLPAAT